MRVSRRGLLVVIVCLSNFGWPACAGAQESDQVVAERILGSQWKQLSRRAGMIFAGTVLTVTTRSATAQTVSISKSISTDRTVPGTASSIEISFRVDRAIAGVEDGQVLMIHEWAGAWSMQRPMLSGKHTLIFLYKPSRLGFTSPVGGSLGQIALDASGKNVSHHAWEPSAKVDLQNKSFSRPRVSAGNQSISVVQLERAIRSAREE